MRFRRVRSGVASALLLSVGIGAVATMLSVGRSLSPAGLPYPAAERLVVARAGGPSWSPAMLEAVTAASTSFESLAGFQERAATLTGAGVSGAADVVRLESVSAAYFALLGTHAAAGRVFGPDEDRRNGSSAVAVISDGLWTRLFNRDVAAVGRTLVVDGHPSQVVGVLPAAFRGLIGRTDVWTPLGSARWLSGDTGPERPSSRWFEVFGRVRAGEAIQDAQFRFATEGRAAILQTPGGDRLAGPSTPLTLTPLADARVPAVVPQAVRVLTGAAGALLVLVIANLASLHLLRTDSRRRELAIRMALGAGARHLWLMAAREACALAAAGAAGGLLLRPVFLSALESIQPPPTSFGIVTARVLTPDAFNLDAGLLVAVLTIACAAALPLALSTVVRARRIDVERALRDVAPAGLNVRSIGRRLVRPSLLTAQAALACVIIGGAALLTRSAGRLLGQDRGYVVGDLVTARVTLPDGYDARRAGGFYEAFSDRLLAEPGITSASVSNCAPGAGRCRRTSIAAVDGRRLEGPAQPTVGLNFVTAGHLKAIGAPVARGRGIDRGDAFGGPLVVVVTEPLAAQLWPGGNPIGRTVAIFTANGSLDGARTVVGTVNPIQFNLESDPGLDVFLPATQAAWSSGMVFVGGPEGRASRERAVRRAAAALDRRVPVFDVADLAAPLARSLSVETFLRRSFAAFGCLGVFLAAFGLYVAAAQAVSDGKRELGIRMALGATPRQIWWLVSARALGVAAVAASAGLVGARWSGAALRAFLHGLSPADPVSLAAGPVVVAVAILIAVTGPARRASREDAAMPR